MAERKVSRAIITNEHGKVLLGRRARGAGENQWALVGGKPDEGETEEQAIVREVREELCVEFTPTFYKKKLDVSSIPNQQWQVYYYTGSVNGELKPKSDEIAAVTFASRQDLDILDIAFDHRERLIEFFEKK